MSYYVTTGKSRQCKTLHSDPECSLLVNARGIRAIGKDEMRVWVLCPHCCFK